MVHSVNIRLQASCQSVCRWGPVSDQGPLPPADKSEKIKENKSPEKFLDIWQNSPQVPLNHP